MYKKERKSKLLKSFLFISYVLIVLAIGNFLSNLFSNQIIFNIGLKIDGLIRLGMFLFSIYCLFQFYKQKFSKITYVIPIWIISIFLISVILGIFLAILQITKLTNPGIILYSQWYKNLGFISNLSGFLFISYLFFSFRK